MIKFWILSSLSFISTIAMFFFGSVAYKAGQGTGTEALGELIYYGFIAAIFFVIALGLGIWAYCSH